jgi:hypothetical protein
MSFFLAMLLYPEAQRKAQRELDTVMHPAVENHGHLSLPTFEDAENLPYITALVQEVLRWNVIAPLGELRCSSHLSISNSIGCLLMEIYCPFWGILMKCRSTSTGRERYCLQRLSYSGWCYSFDECLVRKRGAFRLSSTNH